MVDQATGQAIRCVDHAGGQNHFKGLALSDDLRQPLRSPVTRDNAKRHFGQSHAGIFRSNAHVASQGQFQAAAQCETVDGRNDGFGAAFDAVEQVVLSVLRKLLALLGIEVGKFLDVRAGHKSFFTASSEDNDLGVGLRLRVFNGLSQFGNNSRVEGIQGFGARDGQGQDARVDGGVNQRIRHGVETPEMKAPNYERSRQDLASRIRVVHRRFLGREARSSVVYSVAGWRTMSSVSPASTMRPFSRMMSRLQNEATTSRSWLMNR